ncbi:MAG: DUF5110 domain-containing protein, partial [Bacteroidales bacterium]|nr:DUF5110 domain-containing protein [Bacteroidales bacterium]
GEMDYYFLFHKTVSNILRSYTWLTGRMPMPPKWALGYQQCRWSYYPDSEILSIARTFREKNIPADTIYFDIDHMQDYKLFSWSGKNFPRPSETIGKLREMDFHSAVIVDPGVKIEKDYPVYESGVAEDVFIKYPDGSNYAAEVWPGWCHFPDFTKAQTRKWWGKQFEELVEMGVYGFWNDMNEIASWGGGATPRIVEFDWEGRKTTYRQAKNVYGMLMARATYEGVRDLMENKRPMVLTRAGFAGLQRYSALWTGDNQASEEHMMMGVRLVSSLGLSGVPFAGVDVGGFGGDASKELFARWITIGAFTPFFRGHSAYDTRASEPWSYGETVGEISRVYIQLRYNLMPYLYSVFYKSHVTGIPVARSLAMDYPHDDNIYHPEFENQYLFGPAFLVAPNTSDQKLTKVYLPHGRWYNFFDDRLIAGGQEIAADSPLERLPLFVKAGSIIPVQSPVQSMSQNPKATLYIHLYKGDQATHFVYYEDDGETEDYKSGIYCKRKMKYNPSENNFVIEKPEGTYQSYFKEGKLILHGFDVNIATVNGETKTIEDQNFNFLDPTGMAEESPFFCVNTKAFHLGLFDEKIDVRFG